MIIIIIIIITITTGAAATTMNVITTITINYGCRAINFLIALIARLNILIVR